MAMEFLRQEGWTYTEVSGSVLLVPPKELYKDRSIFKGEDIQTLKQHVQKVSAKPTLGLIIRLSETEITNPWKKYMVLLAKTQRYSSSYQEWIPCKRHALDILELHDKIADRFKSIQDELDRAGYHDLLEAITEKLECLARFDFIYNRQPAGDEGQNRTEPTYTVQQVRKRKKDKDFASENERLVVTAYQQSDRKVRRFHIISCGKRRVTYLDWFLQVPVLVAIALISIILSLVPLVLAWRISGASPGTTSDVDFYLLIQTSIMQLLGLFTAIFPMAKRPASSAWIWAQFFTIVGVLVSVAAVPMYLYLPTMWSALVSFIGSATQIAVTLELALIVEKRTNGLKFE
jgi:hypothetical protein